MLVKSLIIWWVSPPTGFNNVADHILLGDYSRFSGVLIRKLERKNFNTFFLFSFSSPFSLRTFSFHTYIFFSFPVMIPLSLPLLSSLLPSMPFFLLSLPLLYPVLLSFLRRFLPLLTSLLTFPLPLFLSSFIIPLSLPPCLLCNICLTECCKLFSVVRLFFLTKSGSALEKNVHDFFSSFTFTQRSRVRERQVASVLPEVSCCDVHLSGGVSIRLVCKGI